MEIVFATSGCSGDLMYEIADEVRAMDYVSTLPRTVVQRDSWNDGEFTDGDCEDDESEMHRKAEDDITAYELQSEQIATGGILLVINATKHATEGYVGARLLMEMAVAHANRKPIVTLNDVPADSEFAAEVALLGTVSLGGDIENLRKVVERVRKSPQPVGN